ncbi:MAG: hypothetical protein WCL16_05560 [bacterium]
MSKLLFTKAGAPAAEALRFRIFNTIPSATFQMHKLFDLMDIALSTEIQSACITTGTRSRMLFNQGFVDRYCRTDEHLMMLVMHELYHLILGHTRLFPRSTIQSNIAFDAVINSMLCRQFPQTIYTSFFMATNNWELFPARLLRPPPDWPLLNALSALPRPEQRIFEMLYGDDEKSLTYYDIFKLLENSLPKLLVIKIAGLPGIPTGGGSEGGLKSGAMGRTGSGDGEVVLLGDHEGENGAQGGEEESALRDEAMTQIIRRIVEGWPPPPFKMRGRDMGGNARNSLLPCAEQTGARFNRELVRLLRKAGIEGTNTTAPQRRKLQARDSEMWTVVPQLADRRTPSYRALLGHNPVYYQRVTQNRHPVLYRPAVPHVYVDISGSMSNEVPYMIAVLDPLHKRGECRCFAFSTVVDEIRPKQMRRQAVVQTGGTSIDCVTKHILEIPKSRRPRRVLILTDGYVGPMNERDSVALKESHVRLHVGLINSNYRADLKSHVHLIEVLPSVYE